MAYPSKPPGADGYIGTDTDGCYVYARTRNVVVRPMEVLQTGKRDWRGRPVVVTVPRITQGYPYQRLCPWYDRGSVLNRWQGGDVVRRDGDIIFVPNPFETGFDPTRGR